MTEAEELASTSRIEATRCVLRRAAELSVQRGASAEEVAIGSLYAAFDLAERHAGPAGAAIEWLRSCCDVLEQGFLIGGANRG